MSEFLVEAYVSGAAAHAATARAEDVSLAAEQLTREGIEVRFLRSILVLEDETCFYLYRAQSVDAVREAATRAGLRFERVSEVVMSDRAAPPGSGTPAAPSVASKPHSHKQRSRRKSK